MSVQMLTVAILAVWGGAQAGEAGPGMKRVTPPASNRPLLNPGMGIYVWVGPGGRVPQDSWIREVCAIGYFRCDWSDLEPEPGEYTFDDYLGRHLKYLRDELGWRMAFRVMSENLHSRKKYVTPKWVFEAGVPSVRHRGKYVNEQVDPVFWDPKYLELQCRFIRALGQWVERQEGIEFVDIGSIGEWGEMHLGMHIPGRWTEAQLRETGYSEFKYIQAYRRIIDAFADAFPHTRVFLNVGSYKQIDDYAAVRGLHFRQDGLGLHGASRGVDRWLYPEYAFRGVQCNLELIAGLRGMRARGWRPVEVIRKGLEAPVSYMHMNFGVATLFTNPPDEVRDAVMEAARRVGYRFRLEEAAFTCPAHSYEDVAGRVLVQQSWVNEGIAPCYESLALEWSIEDGEGRTVGRTRVFPQVPTTKWAPGKTIEEACIVELPPGTQPGTYRLCVRIFLPERPGVPYFLAMEGGDGQGKYVLGEIQVERGTAQPKEVAAMDYEEGHDIKGVGLPKGMARELARGEGVEEGSALRVHGTSEGTWQYAVLGRVKLIPGARYRLEGWLKVERLTGALKAPHLKVGISDARGTFITNATTGPYDLKRTGQWQRLERDFDCPPNGTVGTICVERGQREGRVEAEILVDRVRLELLRAP